MDFLVDKVDYSVSEFFESFGHNLPKTVIVTQGFLGETVDDTFNKDQVYRLHTTSRQKRIIAKASDRHYSIPLNYPLNVCVVKKHGKIGKEQTLKDIVTDHAFPVDVKFAKDQEFDVGSSTTSANRFPQLKLIDVFDEVYLLGNTIIDGVLDLRVVQFPLYLSLLRLAEITGIKDQPQEKWKRYSAELNELVTQSVQFDLTFGNKDIAVYHEDSFKADTVYTYIEPRTYSNIFSVNQFQPTRGPSKKMLSSTESPSNVYEEIAKTHRRSDVVKPLNEVGREMKSFFEEKERASVAGRPVPRVPGPESGDKHRPVTPVLPKRDPSTKKSTAPSVPPKPNPYANEIPRGTVIPLTQSDQKKISKPQSPLVPRAHPDTLAMVGAKAAPPLNTGNGHTEAATKDFYVAKLSMKELADCMKTLNLSKYISSFQENMVDGAILKELDVGLLKSDFGFNAIEAIRLMKFAKEGHIPK